VKKYQVTFEIELYEPSARPAFARACELLFKTAVDLIRRRVPEVIGNGGLPSAGITGAPHSSRPDGWRLIYTIREL